MKIKIVLIVLIVIAAILGYYIGISIGYNNGFEVANRKNEFKTLTQPIDSLKEQLKRREIKAIISFIHGKAGTRRVDEGGLFNVKYVYYFEGSLSNEAAVAMAKDVRIKMDFISKTNSIIGSDEVTIYDYIGPGKSLNFKQRINPPGGFESLNFSIVSAIGE
jgi:hypothetical protein